MFVADKGSNDVAVFFGGNINTLTGYTDALKPGPRLAAGFGPLGVTVQDIYADGLDDLVITDSDGTIRELSGIGSSGVNTGFFDSKPIDTPIIHLPDLPIGPLNSGFVPTANGIFSVNLVNLTFTQVFVSTTPLTAMTTASLNGETELVVGFAGGKVELFADQLGQLEEEMVFQDPELTDPSDLAVLSTGEIYVTNSGLSDNVIVFVMSGGIPVPDTETVPELPGQFATVQPLSLGGLAQVALLLTGHPGGPSALGLEGEETSAFAVGLGSVQYQTLLTALRLGADEDDAVAGEDADPLDEPEPSGSLGPSLKESIIGAEDALREQDGPSPNREEAAPLPPAPAPPDASEPLGHRFTGPTDPSSQASLPLSAWRGVMAAGIRIDGGVADWQEQVIAALLTCTGWSAFEAAFARESDRKKPV